MPRIVFTVSEDQHARWKVAGHGEMLSLSEWIRQACEARAAVATAAVAAEKVGAKIAGDITEEMRRDGHLTDQQSVVFVTEPIIPARGPSDVTYSEHRALKAKAQRGEARGFRGPDLKPSARKP